MVIFRSFASRTNWTSIDPAALNPISCCRIALGWEALPVFWRDMSHDCPPVALLTIGFVFRPNIEVLCVRHNSPHLQTTGNLIAIV